MGNTHSFSTEIAELIGLKDAIILQHFYYWYQANKTNENMFIDGKVWTYQSRANIAKVFAYLTTSEIKGAIDRLIENGYLVSDNYNKSKYDQTKWYAMTWKALSLYENAINESLDHYGKPQMENGKHSTNVENSQPIQEVEYNKIDNNNSILKNEFSESEKHKNDKYKNKTFDVREDLSYVDKNMLSLWNEWLDYKDEVKKQYKTCKGIMIAYKKLINYSNNNVILANAIIQNAIEKSYDGFFPLTEKQKEYFTSTNSPYAEKKKDNANSNTINVDQNKMIINGIEYK